MLTPSKTGRPQIRPPHRSEPDPLGDERSDGVEGQSGPAVHDGGGAQQQTRVAVINANQHLVGLRKGAYILLVATVSSKLEAPVQGTEERQQDSTVRCLDIQCLVEHGDGDARINVGH